MSENRGAMLDHKRIVKRIVYADVQAYLDAIAERTIAGIEAVNMMRKGQVKRLSGSVAIGQVKLVASLFGVAA